MEIDALVLKLPEGEIDPLCLHQHGESSLSSLEQMYCLQFSSDFQQYHGFDVPVP